MDQGRGQLRDLVLYKGTLYAQTDKAVIQAIDGETGRTLWCKQVGQSKYPSMNPNAGRDLVAVVNGSQLYVLNRFNGDLLYQREISSAPDAGPALSGKRVYIPMSNGRLTAYRLDPQTDKDDKSPKTKKSPAPAEKTPLEADRQNLRLHQELVPPAFCQSFGQSLVQPLVTQQTAKGEYVVWPTDNGFLNIGHINLGTEDSLTLKHRVETGSQIVGQPAYFPPDPKVAGDLGLIFAVSRDGCVHAIEENNGECLWRFSTGEAVVSPPAVLENHVYVSMQLGGMYCLEAKTGKNLWFAPNVVQFVAASKARVYTVDNVGRLVVPDHVEDRPAVALGNQHAAQRCVEKDARREFAIALSDASQHRHAGREPRSSTARITYRFRRRSDRRGNSSRSGRPRRKSGTHRRQGPAGRSYGTARRSTGV